uniref:Transposase n=1 Tax=Knipowitschia caucasica TaxID=637954 RepID=A0AAV2JKY6_KNICA
MTCEAKDNIGVHDDSAQVYDAWVRLPSSARPRSYVKDDLRVEEVCLGLALVADEIQWTRSPGRRLLHLLPFAHRQARR